MARLGSLALDRVFPRNSVLIKTLVVVTTSLNNSLTSGVNETRPDNCESLYPGRCSTGKQLGPSRHQNTATTMDLIF